MKTLVLILSLLISGCATTQEVLIPIAKKCTEIKKPSKPLLCTDGLTGDEKIDLALNCALTDVNKLKIYSEELEILICEED